MGADAPEVDLSSGKYDALETMLSNWLGLKVMLVRGREAKDEQLTSLRDNIEGRDRELAASLTDNDLHSLLTVGHVTRRAGNTEPEEAVIIFDPAERHIFEDNDPVLDFALADHFNDAWCDLGELMDGKGEYKGPPPELKAADFIENFSMDKEDIRRYLARQNVLFALDNQSEYNNLNRRPYGDPRFFQIITIHGGHDSPQMHKRGCDLSYEQARNRYAFETVGIKDPNFCENLKLLGAIANLYTSMRVPCDTFARLGRHRDVNWQQIVDIQERLKTRIEEQVKKHAPKEDDYVGRYFSAESDWRILFPVFREVYEQDTSEGREREYLDTIMEGLKRFFPTITNAPVPKLEQDHEPLRKLEKPAQAPCPRHQPRMPGL